MDVRQRDRGVQRPVAARRRSGSWAVLGPAGGGARGCPGPGSRRAGSRRMRAEAGASSGARASWPDRGARGDAGRRTAHRGRSRACDGCPRFGRNPGPGGRPASMGRRTRRPRRKLRRGRPRGGGDPGPARRAPSPPSTQATPGVAAIRSRAVDAIGFPGGIDVGHLVVADGQCPAAEGVEDLAERARPDREEAGLVRSTRLIGTGRRTFHMRRTQGRPTRAAPADRAASSSGAQASSSSPTKRAESQPDGPKRWGSETEMRQVDQREGGPLGFQHLGRGLGDPLRVGAPRKGPRRRGTGARPGGLPVVRRGRPACRRCRRPCCRRRRNAASASR